MAKAGTWECVMRNKAGELLEGRVWGGEVQAAAEAAGQAKGGRSPSIL